MKRTSILALSLLTACSNTPLPSTAIPDPSDPTAATVESSYSSVLAGTASHRPVQPKPWRELNDRVAPIAGGRQ